MLEEVRRRAYLGAMQIVTWLPRVALPFAAPSRPELLDEIGTPAEETVTPAVAEAPISQPTPVAERVRPELPRPSAPERTPVVVEDTPAETPEATEPEQVQRPVPRFSLQLLRAGRCLLLVDLPTGEPFQRRDPAYLLLRDLLRAAQLPDSPQLVGDGEPIRWPLLRGVSLGQSETDARDYVQTVLLRERESAACIWLVGPAAVRFGGERDEQALFSEFAIEEVGRAWALPGLEQLIEEPALKRPLWQAMKRLMPSWSEPA